MDRRQVPVAGIILAAGMSTRMGRNKLLLPIGGEPMIRRIVKRSVDAGLDPVLVVVGHERELTAAALDRLAYQPVFNQSFKEGITTSLQAGIRALPDHVEGAIMILGDMPFVTATMLDDMMKVFRSSGLKLVQSHYDDVSAPPTLFGRDLFADLLDLTPDRCPGSVAKRYAGSSAILDWPVERLRDLDRPEDLPDGRDSA